LPRAGGKHPRAATARQTNGGTTVRPAFIACHSGLPSNFAPPTSTDVATNRDGEARSRRTAPRRAGSRQQRLQNVHFTRWRSLNSHAGHRPSNASRIALRDTVRRLRLENAAEEALFAARYRRDWLRAGAARSPIGCRQLCRSFRRCNEVRGGIRPFATCTTRR